MRSLNIAILAILAILVGLCLEPFVFYTFARFTNTSLQGRSIAPLAAFFLRGIIPYLFPLPFLVWGLFLACNKHGDISEHVTFLSISLITAVLFIPVFALSVSLPFQRVGISKLHQGNAIEQGATASPSRRALLLLSYTSVRDSSVLCCVINK